MLQDTPLIEQRHENFIKRICATEKVYGLDNSVGFATSDSENYEDENDQPVGVMCFWSEIALAEACAKNDWKNYHVAEITLSEFIEDWCVGIYSEGLMIGTDFDKNRFGYESDSLELILDIVNELKNLGKEIEFKKFENLDDLEEQISDILE